MHVTLDQLEEWFKKSNGSGDLKRELDDIVAAIYERGEESELSPELREKSEPLFKNLVESLLEKKRRLERNLFCERLQLFLNVLGARKRLRRHPVQRILVDQMLQTLESAICHPNTGKKSYEEGIRSLSVLLASNHAAIRNADQIQPLLYRLRDLITSSPSQYWHPIVNDFLLVHERAESPQAGRIGFGGFTGRRLR